MPSEIGKISENVYRFPGEMRGLPLQAGEVAWSGHKKVSGWWVVGFAALIVVAAITVGRL